MISCEKVFDRLGKEYIVGQQIHCRPDGAKLFSIEGSAQQLLMHTDCSIPEQNRLSRESSSLLQVQVPVYDKDGVATGFLMWLKRELPSPVSLERRLMQLPEVPASAAVRRLLAVQMCRIFALVHQEGFVFGFAEPGDFLVSERNRLVCVSTDRCLTTPAEWDSMWYYCAPEVLAADGNCDYRFVCDCYTLGVLLFQILTGSYPFGGGGLLPQEERILEEILDGKSVFFYADRPENKEILARLREYDTEGNAVSQALLHLFQRTFDYSGSCSYEEGRPSLEEWACFMQAAQW